MLYLSPLIKQSYMNIKILILFVFFSILSFGQNASDYFPAQTGYNWYLKSYPLDSLNNPIDSLTYYGIDSFSVVSDFSGRSANIVLTKSGLLNTINYQPFLDTLYFSFDGANGYEYFDPIFVSGLIGNIDSVLALNFLTFFHSLEGWYSYYKLNSTVNQAYTVFSKDTTVIYDSTSLPLRFQLIVKRLADESLTTEIGTFNCKKYLLERRLSYLVSIPPLPTFAVKILGVEENVWLAPGNWKVRSYTPSTRVDFSILGIPIFTVPGLETNVTLPFTSVDDQKNVIDNFILYQNYPNPFNPSTTIQYSIKQSGYVSLKVFNALGEEVLTIINEFQNAGLHSKLVSLNSILPSGVYFYRLSIDGFVQSKKMIYLK